MRIAFMGTPDFAVPVLDALVAAKHEVVAVFTQPPAPVGRGKQIQPSPVHVRADALGLAVHTPATLKDTGMVETVRRMELDALVTAAYGLILPPQYLDLPRLGCFNVHASLLPRWRGAAPIQRAIMAGDHKSGISIIQMDRGVDTGPVLLWERVGIEPNMTALELHDVLKDVGARLIVEVLQRAEIGALQPTPQAEEGALYAHKLDEAEARLDWNDTAMTLVRKVRGLNPWLGTWCTLPDGDRLKVLAAEVVDAPHKGKPGEVLDNKTLVIACGDGALRLTLVQRAGKKPMTADAFLRGCALDKGAVLG